MYGSNGSDFCTVQFDFKYFQQTFHRFSSPHIETLNVTGPLIKMRSCKEQKFNKIVLVHEHNTLVIDYKPLVPRSSVFLCFDFPLRQKQLKEKHYCSWRVVIVNLLFDGNTVFNPNWWRQLLNFGTVVPILMQEHNKKSMLQL